MAHSNDIGIKISNIGWDVKTAGDANLYFSSSWPILKINATDTMNVSGSFSFNHGLPYSPLALIWSKEDGLAPCQSNPVSVSSTFSLQATKIRYFIFRLPLDVAYQAPIVRAPQQPPAGINHDFGLKFAKDGKNLSSTDFRDFTLHSSTRSPILHAVVYKPFGSTTFGSGGSNLGVEWVSDLPYRPLYFAFYRSDGYNFVPSSTVFQSGIKTNYSGNNIVVHGVAPAGSSGSIVVLKDPLDFPAITNITL